ncbi:conserved exported hypothetical protein [Tenacibaculum litopenaei]|uniref:hypothetical protein n=1 Tax=Tenacibaculum litopenaei TaxID=396016 RepID=UPI0038940B2F
MKKKIFFFLSLGMFLLSCSSIKTTQKAISKGNYDEAINLAVKKLGGNKHKEKYQPYVPMLQEAFYKATARDQESISFLEKERNPENLERIYQLYQGLRQRQEKIKPILPLKIMATGQYADFDMQNYTDLIIESKNELSAYLYDQAKAVFQSRNKGDYRRVYDDLARLERLNPNYRDVRALMQEAHAIGTDFVFVSMKNETDKVIPRRLEDDLLNFDTYGLNDFWTVYHSKKSRGQQYDFTLELLFRDINISPEQIHEKEFVREKQIKDGKTFLLDSKGNQVKDSLGNSIKVDKYIKATCHFYRFTQSKWVKVAGQVRFIDNYSRQVVQHFPLQSEFVFEHRYGTYKGDRRALATEFIDLAKLRAVQFPSNEQMIYDVGRDVKEKLKYIITRNKFR